MNIYEHGSSISAVGGSVTSVSLPIIGGLLRQVLIQSATSTTLFRANLQDSNGRTRLNYGYHTGELNDTGKTGGLPLPVVGRYTLNITNASASDNFTFLLAIQE